MFLLFDSSKLFLMCFIGITIANLCPYIMINLDNLDCSECRSEEVMFLLTISVHVGTSTDRVLLLLDFTPQEQVHRSAMY